MSTLLESPMSTSPLMGRVGSADGARWRRAYGATMIARGQWFIAIRIVVIHGTVVGLVWRERYLSLSPPFRPVLGESARQQQTKAQRLIARRRTNAE